jgi:hypothetical protein
VAGGRIVISANRVKANAVGVKANAVAVKANATGKTLLQAIPEGLAPTLMWSAVTLQAGFVR